MPSFLNFVIFYCGFFGICIEIDVKDQVFRIQILVFPINVLRNGWLSQLFFSAGDLCLKLCVAYHLFQDIVYPVSSSVAPAGRHILILKVKMQVFFCILLFLFVSCAMDKQRDTVMLVLQFYIKKGYTHTKKEEEKGR